MENTIGQYAHIAAPFAAAYYLLHAGVSLVHLALQYVDKLPITAKDLHLLSKHAGKALLLVFVAALFRFAPFFMALTCLLCGLVILQILQINRLIKQIGED